MNRKPILATLFLVWVFSAVPGAAQSTGFTYQGKLANNTGNPLSGQYDFQFKLFDTDGTGLPGTQQGTTQTVTNITVTNGIFTVQLDFGTCASCFNGSPRFLEIAVKLSGGGSYMTLAPRQPITATPYAIRAADADKLDGMDSAGFIRNQTTQQMADLNVNGTATANIVGATTQFNINGARAFIIYDSIGANTNTFVGNLAGSQNPTGRFNSFFGNGAGQSTTTGANNSFFGSGSGSNTLGGNDNSFFGRNTGFANSASDNSFFGSFAGAANTVGTQNAFFGKDSGRMNSTGSANSFFGASAGNSNTTGGNNSFFGQQAGAANAASDNSFFGSMAGSLNTGGTLNSFFGKDAGGANTTGSNNSFFGAGAGSSTIFSRNSFFGEGAGVNNQNGCCNSFFGRAAGFTNVSGAGNTALGEAADFGSNNLTNATAIGWFARVSQSNSLVLGGISGVGPGTDTNVGIGTPAPAFKLHIVDSLNTGLRVQTNTAGGTLASFGGNGDFQIDAPGIMGGRFIVKENGNVGIGTTTLADRLQVAGDLRVGTGSTGCVKDADGTIIAGTCSSDARLKREIKPFANLLDQVVRLQPVHFYWRVDEFKVRHFGVKRSFGLIAQEVEKVMPELVSEDEQGYKAVNYSKLPLLTLQAVKELRQENEALKQKLEQQQKEMDALKKLVCLDHPEAEMCKP